MQSSKTIATEDLSPELHYKIFHAINPLGWNVELIKR
jgi:hypothetical protein